MVRTLRCGRSNPGSNPGHGSDPFGSVCEEIFIRAERDHRSFTSVSGIVVSIAAFQAVDPGSIPGHRKKNVVLFYQTTLVAKGLFVEAVYKLQLYQPFL